MKFVISLAVAVGLLATVPSEAAKTTKRAAVAKKSAVKRSARKSQKRVKRKKTSQIQQATATNEALAANSPAAPAAQTTTADIAQTTQAVAPKRWALLVDLWNEVGMGAANRAQDPTSGNNADDSDVLMNYTLIRPSYKVTDNASVALGMEFSNSWGATHQKENGAFEMSDPYVQVVHSKIATLGPVGIKGYFRAYAPFSESSQNTDKGQNLYLRGGLTAGASLSKVFNLSYSIEPRYYFKKNLSYAKTNGDGTVSYTATEQGRFKQWISLGAEAGKWSAYQNLGIRSRFYYQDSDVATGETLVTPQKDHLYMETGVGYQILSSFQLVGGVYTEGMDVRTRDDIALYNDNDSYYFVEGVLTF